MSVEEQTGDRASLVIPKTEVSREKQEETCPYETGDANASFFPQEEVAAENAVETTTEKNGNGEEKATNEIRLWFEQLTMEQKIMALGYSDSAFLAALVAMAPWSAASGQGEAHVANVDWEEMVEIETFAKIANVAVTQSPLSNAEAEASLSSGMEDESNTENVATVPDLENKVNASDVFRIRADDESESVREQQASSDEWGRSRSLLDNLCLVFPSAVCFAIGKTAVEQKDCHPFLTLKQSYWENINDEELLLALDAMARCVFGMPFLLRMSSEQVKKDIDAAGWAEQLVHASASRTAIPRFAVLMTRFESAVNEAYLANLALPKHTDRTSVKEVGSSGNGEMVVDATDSSPQEKRNRGMSSIMKLDTSFFDALKAKATSMAAATDAFDASRLEEFLTQHELKSIDNKEGKNPLAGTDLIFFSLSKLLLSHVKHPSETFATLNDLIHKALFDVGRREIPKEAHFDVSEPAKSAAHAIEIIADNQGHGVEKGGLETAGIQSTSHKKKKRKNKRRKGKSTAHAGSATVGLMGQMQSSTLGNPETQKAEQPLPPSVTVYEVKTESTMNLVLPQSHDSDDTELTAHPEAASVQSDASFVEIQEKDTSHRASTYEGIMISRVEGVLAVAAPAREQPKTGEEADNGADSLQTTAQDDEDDHAWETVEVRPRGNRKKPAKSVGKGSPYANAHSTGSVTDSQASSSRKQKTARQAAARKKNQSRSVAREIIFSILDHVDDEVRRRKRVPARKIHVNPWNVSVTTQPKRSPPARRSDISEKDSRPTVNRDATLRDVVLGRHTSGVKAAQNVSNMGIVGTSSTLRVLDKAKSQVLKTEPASPSKSVISKRKVQIPLSADQNTAPTYQETVSAVSASSNAAVTAKALLPSEDERASKAESGSAQTDEAPLNAGRAETQDREKDPSPTPPLPTLLSPENANSANSSVASSLEVPHTSRRHHHSNSTSDVVDVGYHLLDVCDRLSRDMNLFMSRRALALSTRRRERGALLAALQDTVSTIWPGRGHAEMYGSCATQLDLPSSDLDVVVIGIDQYPVVSPNLGSRSNSASGDSIQKTLSMEDTSGDEASQRSQHRQNRHHSLSNYLPMHTQVNAERVVRLASELEAQPWAVHINAIPTASVPVVKVLADPLKLVAGTTGGDWMMHHQRIVAQTAAAGQPQISGSRSLQSQQYHPPWRGADVMNGLLSLDITFDGPEHGGIGSTHYSARAVAEACQEFGGPPDATPLVQVVMVLKELLAQRKLNEPYSGGLSSYALLLLVVALMRERAVIREEIERAERQRKAMTAGDGSGTFAGSLEPVVLGSDFSERVREHASLSCQNLLAVDKATKTELQNGISPASKRDEQSPGYPKSKVSSSWASIASKTSNVSSGNESAAPQTKADLKKKPTTFADAVARSVNGSTAVSLSTSRPNSEPASIASRDSGRQRPAKGAASNTGNGNRVNGDAEKKQETESGGATSSSLNVDPSLVATPSLYPQGYNDVIEVLCSGPTTAGKLLMHFLLYYGEYFEAQTTAIDISGKHERGFAGQASPYAYYSPYIQRRAPGTIDPITGMLTVDPIVIYDPLEGSEHKNVARRCFAWSSVRWIFAQSYATLSSAVERSATPPATPNGKTTGNQATFEKDSRLRDPSAYDHDGSCDIMDPSSPLLRCLLSF